MNSLLIEATERNEVSKIRDSVCPDFLGTDPVLWVLQSSALVSHKFSSGRQMSRGFPSHKNKKISGNTEEHF
jgi:hypothetical protein